MSPTRVTEDDSRKWRVKREVTMGDIMLAIALVVPMLWAFSKLDSRVSNVEDKFRERTEMQSKIDAAQDAVVKDSLARIETALRDIQQFQLQSRVLRSERQ